MEIKIRKAAENDFQQIHTLITEFASFQKSPEKMKNTVDLMLDEKEFLNCFVAETNNKIIGYCTYFFTYFTWSGKSIYIDDLYVQTAHRGTGTGYKLMEQVFQVGRDEKCKKVRWQVSKWNENAIRFYRGLGAEIDDIELNCDLHLS